MVDRTTNEILEDLVEQMKISNNLRIQEVEIALNRDNLIAGFIRIATNYSVMGMNIDVQEAIINKIIEREWEIEGTKIDKTAESIYPSGGKNTSRVMKWDQYSSMYAIGDVVYEDPDEETLYVCLVKHKSSEELKPSSTTTHWKLVPPAEVDPAVETQEYPDWLEFKTYKKNEGTYWKGKNWISKSNNNTQNQPDISPEDWKRKYEG